MTESVLLPVPGPERAGPTGPERPVAALDRAGQLVLWALRQRRAEGREASATLVAGLRLVFGLGRLEEALAAFERLHRVAAFPLNPVTCPFVGASEERLLRKIGAALEAGPGNGVSDPVEAVAQLLRRAGLARSAPGGPRRLH